MSTELKPPPAAAGDAAQALIEADYSGIEGAVAAWLCREQFNWLVHEDRALRCMAYLAKRTLPPTRRS